MAILGLDNWNRERMELVSVGMYSFPEASRILRIKSRDLRRWLLGYRYKQPTTGELVYSPPLWQSQLANAQVEGVGFRDLIELRFICAFRSVGVSLQTIRLAQQNAREIFENPFPFSARRFRTDGRTIFLEALQSSGESQFIDLTKKQYAFEKIISASLYEGLEFNSGETQAVRWYPLARSTAVKLDPEICFGKAVVTDGSVPTAVLANAVKVEGDAARVAKIFEVPPAAVRAAVRYEQQLAA